jgi:NADH pyrophosphatase NudC (nudix superfamily)
MSIRRTRKEESAVIAQRLAKVRELQKADAAEAQALIAAQAALDAEPRELIECQFEMHYAPISLAVERVACSECGETVMGWEKTWRYCPACGSRVNEVTREDSPHDRLARKAVKEALDSVAVGR